MYTGRGNVLLVELAVMFLLAVICVIVLVGVFRAIPTGAPPGDLTPADAIDDLWTLVRVPVTISSPFLPAALVERIKRFNSDLFFARVPWLNPRTRPWRFCAAWSLALLKMRSWRPPAKRWMPIGGY